MLTAPTKVTIDLSKCSDWREYALWCSVFKTNTNISLMKPSYDQYDSTSSLKKYFSKSKRPHFSPSFFNLYFNGWLQQFKVFILGLIISIFHQDQNSDTEFVNIYLCIQIRSSLSLMKRGLDGLNCQQHKLDSFCKTQFWNS